MSTIYTYLPEHLRLPDGTFNKAFADAVDAGHDRLLRLVQACIDQLFLTTATGRYLVQLGEQAGFVMPDNSGLDIRAYRVLVPLMVSAPKQIRQTVGQVIESFYGSDRTRPSITATMAEPYDLSSGDDINIITERGSTQLSFLDTQVSNIHSISAAEIAAIVNSTQSAFYADTVVDRATAKRFLRLTNLTSGVGAFIRVGGGTIQNVLKFPNLIPTAQQAGTNWIVTKDREYTDVTKVQWDGVGFSPKLYLLRAGDIVTIRSLSGSVASLNGSYEIIDSGFDYFVIRNQNFSSTYESFTQSSADELAFTSQAKVTLYDRSEYGIVSEIQNNTATVTVPAIPPLTRRFLKGSAHLHGMELEVIDFTRDTVTMVVPAGTDAPVGENSFALKNGRMQYDFRRPRYKTTAATAGSNPMFTVVSTDPAYSPLPFTSPTGLGSNPIHGEVRSDEFVVTFPHPHGLLSGWGITLAGATVGFPGLSPSQVNVETAVVRVLDRNRVVVRFRNTQGEPILCPGVQFGPCDVKRFLVQQPDGSDFYLVFPDVAAVTASGLLPGMTFLLDPAAGTNQNEFYGDAIRHQPLYVNSLDGNLVNIRAGFRAGPETDIITGAMGWRSVDFGGASVTYFLDKTSIWNQDRVMEGMRACLLNYQRSSNPEYKGGFIFDPVGEQTRNTLSRFVTKTTSTILRGSNIGIVFVEKVNNVFGTEGFPPTGRILLSFGTDDVEGPVNYIAVISANAGPSQILIDPAYRFKKTHKVGAQVVFVHEVKPYQPGINGQDLPVYITGTAQSRTTLFTLLEDLIAGGIYLQRDVLLPELRYQDVAIPPFE